MANIISDETIEYVGILAKLELSEEEKEQAKKDMEMCIRDRSKEDDFFFDEIGSVLKIKQLRAEKRELLENMETYFRVFFLQEGQDVTGN